MISGTEKMRYKSINLNVKFMNEKTKTIKIY